MCAAAQPPLLRPLVRDGDTGDAPHGMRDAGSPALSRTQRGPEDQRAHEPAHPEHSPGTCRALPLHPRSMSHLCLCASFSHEAPKSSRAAAASAPAPAPVGPAAASTGQGPRGAGARTLIAALRGPRQPSRDCDRGPPLIPQKPAVASLGHSDRQSRSPAAQLPLSVVSAVYRKVCY